MAKLLAGKMKVIILDEPTKGVDVGAKTAIFNIMNDLAEAGYGIIMVSSEMPEVLGMSDRIVVMREGRVSAILETRATTQEEILRAAMARGGERMRRSASLSESFREVGPAGLHRHPLRRLPGPQSQLPHLLEHPVTCSPTRPSSGSCRWA